MQELNSDLFDAPAYAATLLARHRGGGPHSLLSDDESAESAMSGSSSSALLACEAELAALGRASQQVELQVRRLLIDEGGQALLAKRSGSSQGTTAIAALQQRVAAASDAAAGVRASAAWLRRDVSDPLAQLKSVALVLRGVTAATHLARELQSFISIVRRLRLSVDSSSGEGRFDPRESAASLSPEALSRAAPLVRAAAALLRASPQLAALDMVQAEREWLEATAGGMHACAVEDLVRAVASMSPPAIASAAAVLVTLGDMPLQAAAVLHSLSVAAAEPLREALDARCIAAAAAAASGAAGLSIPTSGVPASLAGPAALARGGAGSSVASSRLGAGSSLSASVTSLVPPAGSAPAWRGILWGRIESACGERLAAVISQAWNLVYVLARCAAAPPRDSDGTPATGAGGVPFPFTSLAEQVAAAVLATRSSKADEALLEGQDAGDEFAHAHDDAAEGGGSENYEVGESVLSPDGLQPAAVVGSVDTVLRLPARMLQRALWQPLASAIRREVDALVGSDMNVFVRNALTDAAATSGGTGAAAAGGYPRLHYALLAGHAAARWSAAARSGEHAGGGGVGGSIGLDTARATLGGGAGAPLVFADGMTEGSGFDRSSGSILTRGSLSGVGLFDAAFPSERLLWAVAPLLRLFLARSLSRLTDSLHAMFAGGAASAAAPVGLGRKAPAPSSTSAAGASAGSSAASSAAAVAALFGSEAAALASTGASNALSPGQRAVLACFTPSHQFSQLMGASSGAAGSGADLDAATQATAGVPTAAAAAAFVRAMHSELQLCRPPSSLSVALPGAASAAAGSTGALTVEADASLYAAVSRCVWTASRLLAARAESTAAPPPAATALSPTFTPTPAQRANAALACRLLEVRAGLLRAAASGPGGLLPPSVLSVCNEAAAALGWSSLEEGSSHTSAASAATAAATSSIRIGSAARAAALDATAPPSSVGEARARRAMRHPLLAAAWEGDGATGASTGSSTAATGGNMFVQLPPHLLAVEVAVLYGRAAAARAESTTASTASAGPGHRSALLASLAPALAASAPGMLVAAAGVLEKACEALIAPWMRAIAAPLEASVLRIHEAAYGAASSATAVGPPAAAPSSLAASAPAVGAAAVASEYALSLERMCDGISKSQLSLLGPAGGASPLADACRALLATRVLTLWTRHATLQRGVAPSGPSGTAPLTAGATGAAAAPDAAPVSAEQAAARARLLRDAAVIESAAALLLGRDGDKEGERPVPRCVVRAHTELRHLKPLLHVGLHEVIDAALSSHSSGADSEVGSSSGAAAAAAPLPRAARIQNLIRALRPAMILHSCVARLPAECLPPWASSSAAADVGVGRSPFANARVYSASLDSRVLAAAAELEPGFYAGDAGAGGEKDTAKGLDTETAANSGSGLGVAASAVMLTLGPSALAECIHVHAWSQLRGCVEAMQSRGSSTASSIAHAAAALLGSSA